MTSLPIALSAALLHFVWQGVAVALLLWAVLGMLRKTSPSVRYIVCCAALGLLALMPVVTVWLLYEPPPAVTERALFLSPRAGFHSFAAIAPVRWADLARQWILPMWALGVVLFSFRMMWFCGQAAWMRRRGEQAGEWLVSSARNLALRMGVTQKFSVLVSTKADGPSVIGWLRPVIVMPAAAIAGLTPEQLEAVLAHELAHILRADYLVNLLQSLIETLLFYHPAVWWVSGRIRCERELCCDDLAVRACGDALTYARALSVLERLRMRVPRMAMASTGGALGYRIRRIVGAEIQAAGISKAPGIVALILVVALGGMNLNRVKAQAQPASPAKAPVAPLAPVPALQEGSRPAVAPKSAALHQLVVSGTDQQQAEKVEIAPQYVYGANAELVNLWQQFDSLSKIFTPDHPNIVRIRKRIDEIEAQIKKDQEAGDSAAVAITREQALDLQRLRGRHGLPAAAVALGLNRDDQLKIYEARLLVLEAERAKERDSAQVTALDNQILATRAQIALKREEEFTVSPDTSPEVEKITISGLSSEAGAQVRAQMGLHEGSHLSSFRFPDAYPIVGSDKRLEFAIVMLPDGKAEVRVTAATK